jgi:peptidoglycan/xylan/chitin deacetylase (PgdA/CDA1 family)
MNLKGVTTLTIFAFTNDDPGMQQPELFAELLDFLADQGVPGTFFVVPYAGQQPLDAKPAWVALLQRALADGHELAHHGYTHETPFEFGVPPGFMLDIIPDAKTRWQSNPASVAPLHTAEVLRHKLEAGRVIFQRTLGFIPTGFRSPCLGMCDTTYATLADMGFQWSSNQVINPRGWRYINRDYAAGEPWTPGLPPRPFRHAAGVTEIPMHSEYTWYLTEDDVERHFQLAKADFDRAHANGDAFVALSHYYAMTGQWATGLRVYEKLFDYARQQGDVQFVTLSQLVAAQKEKLNHELTIGNG